MEPMKTADIIRLKEAKDLLENGSDLIQLVNSFGELTEKGINKLSIQNQQRIEKATVKAVEQAWKYSLKINSKGKKPPLSDWWHTFLATVSGAVGGVAIITLIAELPVTTIIILRAIIDIAKREGENPAAIMTKLACLEVFAFGGGNAKNPLEYSEYYQVRISLQGPIERSSRDIAKKGVSSIGAPFLAQLITKIAVYYQTFLSIKVAAKIIPLAGAIGGAAVNVLFIKHFQQKAHGHFIVRRLEREYGADYVKNMYQAICRYDADKVKHTMMIPSRKKK
jgi:hypothetical protein